MKISDLILCHYFNSPLLYDAKWQYLYNDINMKGFYYYYELKDTIHYNALASNDYSLYLKYIEGLYDTLNLSEIDKKTNVQNKYEYFKHLCDNFDIEKIGKFEIYPAWDKFTIRDGLHRLSIMLHKGIITDEIPDEFITTRQMKIENELVKTVGNQMYNGWHSSRTKYGYHTFSIDEIFIRGQRDCKARLNEFRKHYDFTDKNVLDFGCNVGGMMFHLTEIKNGLGVDYDENVIAAAENISEILQVKKLKFIKHDFDKDSELQLLKNPDFINFKPDVIFLLSLAAWIKNFDFFYNICMKSNCKIFFEGDPKYFIDNGFIVKSVMTNSYDDITGNYGRTAFFIEPPINFKIHIPANCVKKKKYELR